MNEFKHAGDVMVFTCQAFKIEVAPNGAERIEFNDERFSSIDAVTEAFKVLDMMIEHKAKHDDGKKVTDGPSNSLSSGYSGTCMRRYPEKVEGI